MGIFGSTPTKTEGKLEKRLIFYTPPNRGDRDAEKLCPDWENEEGQTRQIKDKPYKEFSLYWVIDSQIGLYIKESHPSVTLCHSYEIGVLSHME